MGNTSTNDHMGCAFLSINVFYHLVYRLTEHINYLLYSNFPTHPPLFDPLADGTWPF